jgi:hypothetical protein
LKTPSARKKRPVRSEVRAMAATMVAKTASDEDEAGMLPKMVAAITVRMAAEASCGMATVPGAELVRGPSADGEGTEERQPDAGGDVARQVVGEHERGQRDLYDDGQDPRDQAGRRARQ